MRHNPAYGIMRAFMEQGGVKCLGCRRGRGGLEPAPLRQNDDVGRRPAVKGSIAAIADFGTGVGNEIFDILQPLGEIGARRYIRRREALDLSCVEHIGGFAPTGAERPWRRPRGWETMCGLSCRSSGSPKMEKPARSRGRDGVVRKAGMFSRNDSRRQRRHRSTAPRSGHRRDD